MNLLENIEIKEMNLDNILKEIQSQLPKYISNTIYQIILDYAEKMLKAKESIFPCEKCGNKKEFKWKSKHGKLTKLLTIFGLFSIPQMQLQCKKCNHKFLITRKILGIEKRKQTSKRTERQLGLTGSLTSYRVSEKILSFFGTAINKMLIWRCVQKVGNEIQFDLDANELAEGEADGTGIPTYGKSKRGRELKVFAQRKKAGGIRIAGLSIGSYNGEWDKLFEPIKKSLKKFKKFFLVTDGDSAILESIKEYVEVTFQRCLWHIPYQFKYFLWKDGIKKGTKTYYRSIARILDIVSIRSMRREEKMIKELLEIKVKNIEKLLRYLKIKKLTHTYNYLQNAFPDLFTGLFNKSRGKTTSLVERVMRTVNMRINLGKWTEKGALNVNKIRLAFYYNKWDVDN